jgi:peroxiredoxin
MALTDSKTGTTFKLSDYAGKVVILEMMDPFCYLCADQLKEVAAALEVVGDKAVAVSADVGKGESALLKWGEKNGVTWPLAIMPLEFRQALVAEFGSQVVAPSNTPVVIVDPSGIGHITERGIKKSETLVDLVNQWSQ